MKKIFLFLLLSASLSLGQEDIQSLLVEGIQSQPDVFEQVALGQVGEASSFTVSLGDPALTLKEGSVFDGFRFVAPKNSGKLDFVWYFNAPGHWKGWYLCPVEGDFRRSFKSWLKGDKVYEGVDGKAEEGRLRILQTLQAGYFEEGKEYVMWFSRNEEGEDSPVKGKIAFMPAKGERWDYEAIEDALGLVPLPALEQVKALKSKGGEILLNEKFFDPAYGAGRIDSAFFTLRQTKNLEGGFFITMQIEVPACESEPLIADIIETHGPADFVQTAAEEKKLAEFRGGDPDAVELGKTTYYYDYFGFEVMGGKVQRVVSQASDFSTLNPEKEGWSYGGLAKQNLTTFYHGEKEVGRLYYFREGGKKVVVAVEPPAGKYRNKLGTIEYFGDGRWTETSLFPDESVARVLRYEAHQLAGQAEGFYRGGGKSFVASYRAGILDGKLVEFREDGTVEREREFAQGELMEEKEEKAE
ncbi:hypothetical protein [Roseibacillus persicicus]|uniref:MORN repeat variant n=1 Tax=Roseibacillus persicicus TaxID=454148 RepID=A0A918TQL2_9BACT|nr:hypothetical protein [Roseibacillus persicicus]GHC52538.1 hypothetical protein GCM10007100_18560 [Roseibacillus persicicus]